MHDINIHCRYSLSRGAITQYYMEEKSSPSLHADRQFLSAFSDGDGEVARDPLYFGTWMLTY